MDTQTSPPLAGQTRWYIVHTYSGHEDRVVKSLKQRVQSLGFEDRIFDIIVPKRNTIKVSGGKKESVKEKEIDKANIWEDAKREKEAKEKLKADAEAKKTEVAEEKKET